MLSVVTQNWYVTVLWIHGPTVNLLVQHRVEMSFRPAVTAVLFNHSAMYTWTDCNVVRAGLRENSGSGCSYCSTVTSH